MRLIAKLKRLFAADQQDHSLELFDLSKSEDRRELKLLNFVAVLLGGVTVTLLCFIIGGLLTGESKSSATSEARLCTVESVELQALNQEYTQIQLSTTECGEGITKRISGIAQELKARQVLKPGAEVKLSIGESKAGELLLIDFEPQP